MHKYIAYLFKDEQALSECVTSPDITKNEVEEERNASDEGQEEA